jgi:hypothetical protein
MCFDMSCLNEVDRTIVKRNVYSILKSETKGCEFRLNEKQEKKKVYVDSRMRLQCMYIKDALRC